MERMWEKIKCPSQDFETTLGILKYMYNILIKGSAVSTNTLARTDKRSLNLFFRKRHSLVLVA